MDVSFFVDIDGVLACTHVHDNEQAAFFKQEGAIITALRTHYIFPGVIEFIKHLFQIPNARVSFFSAGAEERNRSFVSELLKLAFPTSLPEVEILSRHHLTDKKKDLMPYLRPGDLLENAVLIDDNSTHELANGQTFLYLATTDEDDFDCLETKFQGYQGEEYKVIPCMLFSPQLYENKQDLPRENDVEKTSIKLGRYILITKTEVGFEVEFLHLESKSIERKSLDLHAHHQLLALEAMAREGHLVEIKDEKVQAAIHKLVEEWGGYYRKICRRVNRIFSAVGILSEALKLMNSQRCTFKAAYKLLQDREIWPLRKVDLYYHIGLELLRAHNPGLCFVSPLRYMEIKMRSLTRAERVAIEAARTNEEDDS